LAGSKGEKVALAGAGRHFRAAIEALIVLKR
jgi:hypothetical protein